MILALRRWKLHHTVWSVLIVGTFVLLLSVTSWTCVHLLEKTYWEPELLYFTVLTNFTLTSLACFVLVWVLVLLDLLFSVCLSVCLSVAKNRAVGWTPLQGRRCKKVVSVHQSTLPKSFMKPLVFWSRQIVLFELLWSYCMCLFDDVLHHLVLRMLRPEHPSSR